MPESGNHEDNKRIPNLLALAASATPHRNIDVIAEPGRKRNVPAAPEFSDVSGEIRKVEVSHQLDAEELRATYCYVGIS